HRQVEPLVDAGVELDVHRERVLDAERVSEYARDEQAAARDSEHEVGGEAVGLNRRGELTGAEPELLPRHQVGTCVAHASPAMSSGRTGTRVRGRPVASRSAATIAAVETTVGGSPTPFNP